MGEWSGRSHDRVNTENRYRTVGKFRGLKLSHIDADGKFSRVAVNFAVT